MNIDEFNTDSLTIINDGFSASFRLKISDENNNKQWHFYGTLIPGDFLNNVPCTQHNAITVLLNDLQSLAYDIARQIAQDALTSGI